MARFLSALSGHASVKSCHHECPLPLLESGQEEIFPEQVIKAAKSAAFSIHSEIIFHPSHSGDSSFLCQKLDSLKIGSMSLVIVKVVLKLSIFQSMDTDVPFENWQWLASKLKGSMGSKCAHPQRRLLVHLSWFDCSDVLSV